jgi:uncharacterized phage protein (TIGR01671 family)
MKNKFRMWDKVKQRMYGGEYPIKDVYLSMSGKILVENYNTYESQSATIWFDDFVYDDTENLIPLQCIGECDKNGKEIYEGDIVVVPGDYCGDCYYQTTIGEVRYEVPEFYVYSYYDVCGVTMQDFEWNKLEVIGNIYETPELMEREKPFKFYEEII